MVNKERLLSEFMHLVQIDSETKFERRICNYLINKLTELGFTVYEDNSASITGHEAGNIVATLVGTRHELPVVMYTAHMDTVAPGRGIKPFIKNGFITSDGTTILGSDGKAGIAALIEAAHFLNETNVSHGTIQFVITVGEEAGLVGAKAIQRDYLMANYGFTFDGECAVGDVIVRTPTLARMSVSIFGSEARRLLRTVISRMSLGRIDSETTASIVKIVHNNHQTEYKNDIHNSIYIEVKVQSSTTQKVNTQLDTMENILRKAARQLGFTVSVQKEILFSSYDFTEDDPVVQHVIRAVNRIGRSCRLLCRKEGSDANVFTQLGIPTVNLGVGHESIHSTKERIRIDELVKTAELAINLIRETRVV